MIQILAWQTIVSSPNSSFHHWFLICWYLEVGTMSRSLSQKLSTFSSLFYFLCPVGITLFRCKIQRNFSLFQSLSLRFRIRKTISHHFNQFFYVTHYWIWSVFNDSSCSTRQLSLRMSFISLQKDNKRWKQIFRFPKNITYSASCFW